MYVLGRAVRLITALNIYLYQQKVLQHYYLLDTLVTISDLDN